MVGVYAVPEGYQHAVSGRADGGRGRGAVEPSQTHRAQSAAAGRSPTRPVSPCCHLQTGRPVLRLVSLASKAVSAGSSGSGCVQTAEACSL